MQENFYLKMDKKNIFDDKTYFCDMWNSFLFFGNLFDNFLMWKKNKYCKERW